jgi:DNA polymerase-1
MGIAPAGATKQTHPTLREKCKTISLGVNYGMQPFGLARRLGIGEEEAGDLIARHRQTFPKYWAWSEGLAAHARTHKLITTPFGWPMHVPRRINERTLINWPQQALGGDLLRLATMALLQEGHQVYDKREGGMYATAFEVLEEVAREDGAR